MSDSVRPELGSVAVVHDAILVHGGAEHVAVELARALDAPLYVGVAKPDLLPGDVDVRPVLSGVTRRMRESDRLPELVKDVLDMLVWQQRPELAQYETVVLNKMNVGWYVPRDTQRVVTYSHSTPRGLYDQAHNRGGLNRLFGPLQRALWAETAARCDTLVVNSELVARRWELYHGVDRDEIEVVYPPVDTRALSRRPTVATPTDADEFYLYLGRLHPAKRLDWVLKTWAKLPTGYPRLVVAGDGPERDRLEGLAAELGLDAEFVGYVSEPEKRALLADAKALVAPNRNEDFGLTVVEAFAAGTPVLGVDDGYTRHQLLDGRNGLRFAYDETGGALLSALTSFERFGVGWDAEQLRAFAQRFDRRGFAHRMRRIVFETVEQTRVAPPWKAPRVPEPKPEPKPTVEVSVAELDDGPVDDTAVDMTRGE